MTNWTQVRANSNLIQKDTGKAVLVKFPGTDWMFWHPAKCVRTSGKSGYKLEVSFTENWEFTVFRTGKNFKKLDEKKITPATFKEWFGENAS